MRGGWRWLLRSAPSIRAGGVPCLCPAWRSAGCPFVVLGVERPTSKNCESLGGTVVRRSCKIGTEPAPRRLFLLAAATPRSPRTAGIGEGFRCQLRGRPQGLRAETQDVDGQSRAALELPGPPPACAGREPVEPLGRFELESAPPVAFPRAERRRGFSRLRVGSRDVRRLLGAREARVLTAAVFERGRILVAGSEVSSS